MFDEGSPKGDHYYWSRSTFVNGISENTVGEIVEMVGDRKSFPHLPNNYSIEFMQLGGQICKKDPKETAFFHRSAKFEAHAICRLQKGMEKYWNEKGDLAWLRSVNDLLENDSIHPGGGYINIMNDIVESDKDVEKKRAQKIKQTYSENYERLLLVKEKYDPNNFFSHNHNIQPSKPKKFKKISY